jgi:hypothetical protein
VPARHRPLQKEKPEMSAATALRLARLPAVLRERVAQCMSVLDFDRLRRAAPESRVRAELERAAVAGCAALDPLEAVRSVWALDRDAAPPHTTNDRRRFCAARHLDAVVRVWTAHGSGGLETGYYAYLGDAVDAFPYPGAVEVFLFDRPVKTGAPNRFTTHVRVIAPLHIERAMFNRLPQPQLTFRRGIEWSTAAWSGADPQLRAADRVLGERDRLIERFAVLLSVLGDDLRVYANGSAGAAAPLSLLFGNPVPLPLADAARLAARLERHPMTRAAIRDWK